MMDGILTPVQMEGLRLLLTPFPQQQFNQTADRKVEQASLGVTCLDCHVNGHTNATFHLNPDTRPQADAVPHRHGQSARHVQSADPRLQAVAAIRRGLHRIRTAHRLLRRRPGNCGEEGRPPAGPVGPGSDDGADAKHVRFPAGAEARCLRQARSGARRRKRNCGANRCSTARVAAASATRRRSSSTTRCTT